MPVEDGIPERRDVLARAGGWMEPHPAPASRLGTPDACSTADDPASPRVTLRAASACWAAAVALSAAGLVGAHVAAPGEADLERHWGEAPAQQPQFPRGWNRCPEQWEERQRVLDALARDRVANQVRLRAFTAALEDPSSPLFPGARDGLDAEIDRQRTLASARQSLLPAASWSDVALFAAVLAGLVFVGHWLIGFGTEWAERDGQSGWRREHWLVGAVVAGGLFAVQLAQEQFTSVAAIRKDWFGPSSYCVSSLSWSYMRIAVLGTNVAAAVAIAAAWRIGERKHVPSAGSALDDGGALLSRYLDALRAVLFLGLLVVVGAVVAGVAWSARASASAWYLATPAASFGVAAWLCLRCVWNVTRVRRSYALERWRFENSHPGRAAPPDPTESFWAPVALPGFVVFVLISAWTAVVKLGGAGGRSLLELIGLRR